MPKQRLASREAREVRRNFMRRLKKGKAQKSKPDPDTKDKGSYWESHKFYIIKQGDGWVTLGIREKRVKKKKTAP